MNEAEVAAGDPDDRGDGLGVREVGVIEIKSKLPPAPGENECQFFVLQRPVGMGEADTAVEWVAGQPHLDAGHADQDKADTLAVEHVAEIF